MIVSASYKTDIPAFYGEWFRRRLRTGFARALNPIGGQPFQVSLRRRHVDGFVFWTKNLVPFLPVLEEVAEAGYPFVIQYTINGYPRPLEPSVIEPERSVACLREVARRYGPRVAVWRYDPILFTSLTPASFHRARFARLAAQLEGATDEVVISFAQIYRKTRRHLDRTARRFGLRWWDPNDELKRELAADLAERARRHGMQLTVCAQAGYVAGEAREARCIDAERLSDVAGFRIRARRRGNRPDCRCHESRDIGEYESCPQGCVYCYAVASRRAARRRMRMHDPGHPYLVPPGGGDLLEDGAGGSCSQTKLL